MTTIDTSQWGEFRVVDLFERIERGRGSGAGSYMDGDVPYIAASFAKNGFVRLVEDQDGALTSKGNCIALISNGNGGIGRNTYQPVDFVGSSDLQLAYHHRLNEWNGLFLVACLNKSIERYNYSFAWKRTGKVFQEETVFLPQTENAEPDWALMEQTMRNCMRGQQKELDSLVTLDELKPREIDTSEWGEFQIDELFDVVKGSRLTTVERFPGEIPYVGASQFNNGITHYIGNEEKVHPGGVLTVCYNGPVGTTFYQPVPFWATDDVNVLYPKADVSASALLFVAPIIEKVGSGYAYIDKWKLSDMKSAIIRLPIDATGDPDWARMEAEMKVLMADKGSGISILSSMTRALTVQD